VTDYLARGSLAQLIHSEHSLAFDLRMQMCRDVASGMAWLHAQKPVGALPPIASLSSQLILNQVIVHRDLYVCVCVCHAGRMFLLTCSCLQEARKLSGVRKLQSGCL
jgi:hypothetical protein